MNQKVAVIGLGSMGSAMAERLRDQGAQIEVWNRSEARRLEHENKGFAVSESVHNAFEADIVISALSNDQAVLSTFDRSFLASANKATIHVNIATVSLEAARELESRHRSAGVRYLAAPVLGRPAAVRSGSLLMVVGGDTESLKGAREILDLVAAEIFHLGEKAELASLVKLGVNYNLIHALQAIGESVTLVEAGGVDASQFISILTHTAFTGSAYTGYGPMIANRDYSPAGFSMALGLKDVGLVLDAAQELEVELPVAPVIKDLFNQALSNPALIDLDWSAVAEVNRKN